MKIYIDHFNLDILSSVMNSLDEFHTNTETYIEVYSDEGIYQIDNNSILQLKPVDEKYSIHKNYYNDFTIIVDPSYFNKEPVSSIIGGIMYNRTIQRYVYKLNKTSQLMLVIEGTHKPIPDHPLQPKFHPNNIYFETNEPTNTYDVHDPFFKKELTEFLSTF